MTRADTSFEKGCHLQTIWLEFPAQPSTVQHSPAQSSTVQHRPPHFVGPPGLSSDWSPWLVILVPLSAPLKSSPRKKRHESVVHEHKIHSRLHGNAPVRGFHSLQVSWLWKATQKRRGIWNEDWTYTLSFNSKESTYNRDSRFCRVVKTKLSVEMWSRKRVNAPGGQTHLWQSPELSNL